MGAPGGMGPPTSGLAAFRAWPVALERCRGGPAVPLRGPTALSSPHTSALSPGGDNIREPLVLPRKSPSPSFPLWVTPCPVLVLTAL